MRGSRQPGGQPADAVYILEARRPIIRARGLLESVRPAVLDPRIDSTVRIEHLSVKNWRNFKRAEIDIGRRLFIVGPNASGKSNLLDALRFLHDVADRGLRHAVQSRGGMARVRCLSARNNNYGRVALKAVITENTHTKWTYELQLKGTVHPTVAVEKVTKNDERILERPEPTDKKDLKLLTQTALEHVSSNQNFRPIAESFSRVRYMHLVPQIIRHYELGQEDNKDPYGSGFLVDIAQTNESTRTRRLEKITEALRFTTPRIVDLSFARDGTGKPHLQARYDHWRPDPALQDERDLSDGTLRLIGMLWLLQEATHSNRVVLLEEPELSLHASIIRQLPAILYRMTRGRGSQVILSTHSTEMLKDPGLGVNEVVVLEPSQDGTIVTSAADLADTDLLITADLNLDEILEPITRPSQVERLSLTSR